MSQSWGHAIRSASPTERRHLTRYPGAKLAPLPDPLSEPVEAPRVCRSGKCAEPVAYVTSYRYVTGQAGRVSMSERLVCAEHGRRFAEKHGLYLPPDEPGPEPPPRLLDEAVRGMREGLA